ncbi:MAG TPA: PAS domain S-box protein, partial [Chryseolinea sp.]|nr:PAS domain S-box protein [Chryseolinea sp.]
MKQKVFVEILIILFAAIPALGQSSFSVATTSIISTLHVLTGIAALVIPFIFWRFVTNREPSSMKRPFIFIICFVVSLGIVHLGNAFMLDEAESTLVARIYPVALFISFVSLISLMVLVPRVFKHEKSRILDKQVAERTSELHELNRRLRMEIEVRKDAEKEVAKREKRFKALIENIADGIILSDENSSVIYQSPSVTRILGYPAEDRRPKPLLEYVHEEDKAAFLKLTESLAVLPGQPLQFQFRFKHHNGNYIWLEGIVLNLLHDRNVNGYVTNYRDVTERRVVEERLRHERHLLRTLIDNIPDYIYIKDNELRHVVNNKANVALIGAASEAETIGKTVLDYFDADLAKSFMEEDRKVLESKQPVLDLEEKIIGYANEVRWLLTSKIPLFENDNVVGLVGISRDITERKNAEMLLKELNASLAMQASKLATSNSALQQFAYVVSHDLQEPLRMVKSFLELLKKKQGHLLDEE